MFGFKRIQLSADRLLGFTVAGLCVWAAGSAVAQADPPNIVFFLTEDQGAQVSHQAFSQFNGQGVQTPNMDALINGGTGFTQAFVTTPVCSASKASIYTSLYGHANGIRQNTLNYFMPAEDLTQAQRNSNHYQNASIELGTPTLVTELSAAGYHTGVTHKLHVLKNELFPYDDWISSSAGSSLDTIIDNAGDKPFFAMMNYSQSHRLFGQANRVNPNEVDVPDYLPDTAVAREEWASYLSRVEDVDDSIGDALQVLQDQGVADNTIIIFMGDHGPAYHRGKMAPHDFGSRVAMSISGPGLAAGQISDALVSGADIMPTLLDLAGIQRPTVEHGQSLLPLLSGQVSAQDYRDYVVTSVSADQFSNANQQERSIFDGQYRLIYREKLEQKRTVNQDLWDQFYGTANGANALTYWEIVSNPDQYADEFEALAKIHNAEFNTAPPQFELYDQSAGDIYNLNDLADNPAYAAARNRLYVALRRWAHETNDDDTVLMSHLNGESVGDDFDAFSIRDNHDNAKQVVYTAKQGDLAPDPDWKTRITGNNDDDFVFDNGTVDAPAGVSPLATHDALFLQRGQNFSAQVKTQVGGGIAAGLVFGYTDESNYFAFQLFNGNIQANNGKDLRLVRVADGQETEMLTLSNLGDIDAQAWYTVKVDYDAELELATLSILDGANTYFTQLIQLTGGLEQDSQFGINTRLANTAHFDDFTAQTFDLARLVGDLNADGQLDPGDIDAIRDAFGTATLSTAAFNLATPDASIDADDVHEWLTRIFPAVTGYETDYGDANLDGQIDDQDLLAVLGNFGSQAGWAQGDFNGDGTTDFRDLETTLRNFNASNSDLIDPETGQWLVPEPGSLAGLMAGTLAMLGRNRP